MQLPSLSKRETEVQKEGRTGPLSHSTWVSEEKRPGNPSEMPASRLSKSRADTSNCLGPTGPLPAPVSRAAACLLCWAGEQEGALKGKKTERLQGGKDSKSAQLGWVWSRPLSPAHNSQESCPSTLFWKPDWRKDGAVRVGEMERGQKSRVS